MHRSLDRPLHTLEEMMMKIARLACAAALTGCFATAAFAADAPKKNWTAPAQKIYAQKLSDETMAKHPELLSVTLHGVPPGRTTCTRCSPARSRAHRQSRRSGRHRRHEEGHHHRRSALASHQRQPEEVRDPDADARRSRREHRPRRLRVEEPAGQPNASKVEEEYLAKSNSLRDDLAKQIPSYKALFDPANKPDPMHCRAHRRIG